MYRKRLNSSPPIFHACNSYISEVRTWMKNWWNTIQAFTVLHKDDFISSSNKHNIHGVL